MSNPAEAINALIEEGKNFTWDNVGRKTTYGSGANFLSATSPEWVAWETRVNKIISDNFDEDSAAARNASQANYRRIVGELKDKFQDTRDQYLAALEQAAAILKDDAFDELLKRERAIAPHDLTNKVFIVHGHDDAAKNELEIMLRDMGLDPIVLHRQADEGQTVIEKFEAHADVGYAFILLTPDEVAYLVEDAGKPDADRVKELRARPNVIFEFGYFVGRLSRKRTCCLYRGSVALPSDLNGLIYKPFQRSVEEQGWAIQRELKAAGYKLK